MYNFQMQQPPPHDYNLNPGIYGVHPVHGQQQMPTHQPIQSEVQIQLKQQEQWMKLHRFKGGNEMLVLVYGKSLFPKIQYQVRHLNASQTYIVGIKMKLLKPRKFVHAKGAGWKLNMDSDELPEKESNEVFITESGENLMKIGIDFGHVKIYNEKILKDGEVPEAPEKLNESISCKVYLRCLYVPVLTIYENDRNTVISQFQFDETQFMTVSRYNNEEVIEFKKQNDKYVAVWCRNKKGKRQEKAELKKAAQLAKIDLAMKARRSKKNEKKLKGCQDVSSGTSPVSSMSSPSSDAVLPYSGSPVSSILSSSSGPTPNGFRSPQSLSGYDSTDTSTSSNLPRPSISPPDVLSNQIVPPQASTSSGAARNHFCGSEFSNASSSSEISCFELSPPMQENPNPSMPSQVFPNPMANYSNPMAANASHSNPMASNLNYSNPMTPASYSNPMAPSTCNMNCNNPMAPTTFNANYCGPMTSHPNYSCFKYSIFWALTCASFQAIFVVTSINFIFRYFALERQGRLKYFAGKRLLLWIVAPWVMGTMSMTSTILMGPRESMTERLRPDLLRRFNLNIDKTTYSGCFYYTIDEFGNYYINWRELWYVSILNVMIWVSLFSILYFGYKSYKIVKGLIAQGESEYSRNLQAQLYKALVAQTLIPVFFIFIPVILYFISPYIGLCNDWAALLLQTLCQLYPFLDPIPIIFLVDDYRNAFLNFFRRVLSKNQVASVQVYEPNQDSLSP
ncbi:hypothetical protein B9Z55_012820 [Caenorhabditis nigoni]|uniref:T-box domain-containing protein n=2 Tax=Caenorhabditis nigoni TaxID=1611254 RepID=A0A2G5TZ47_9PELO|nr:hypothetical protein B9Z55_012820 [Caenorhabditis nigoni]